MTSATTPSPTATYEFDEDYQAKIIALMIMDPVFARKTQGLILPEYFRNDGDAAVVASVIAFYERYKTSPDHVSLTTFIKGRIADRKIRSDLVPTIKESLRRVRHVKVRDSDFVVDEVVKFARHQAMENAILASAEALEKRDFASIEKLINGAMRVGQTVTSHAYKYFAEIENRTERRKELAAGTIKRDGITTGYEILDKHLYHHGWGRKELSVIMGAAKAGKSMSLGDFAKCASFAGRRVLYVTLEVAAAIIADRMDANISGTAMKELESKPFHVKDEVAKAAAKAPEIEIHEYASGTFKPMQLRALLDEYRSEGVNFDMVVVDYADIMAPDRFSGDVREDMRLIYLELRAIAFDYNVAMLTATQTNREGAKSAVAKMTDIAEDFNKVRTCDVLISINATEDERKLGEARLYFAASRNSESGFSIRVKQEREKMRFISKVLGKEL